MVNIVIHIENKWFFFNSSFSVNLKIYTFHCDPAEEKNIFFFSKVCSLGCFFPPFWGKSPSALSSSTSSISCSLPRSSFGWMDTKAWEHLNTLERWWTRAKGPMCSGSHETTYSLHHPSHAYSKTRNYTHTRALLLAQTHFPHRHPLTVLKQKDKKKKLNLSPNNDIKNKTLWTFTIIISARGQEEAGAAVIL